ncbi:CHAT domain-containing protein [Mycena amicta]|nr:CHAT domain-containing protein [Mycena amicta]
MSDPEEVAASRLAERSALEMELYEREDDLEALDTALSYAKQAAALVPDDDPHKADYLQKLAATHTRRYNRLGHVADLESAVQYDQRAVDLTPLDHPERAERLRGLAVSYSDRFSRLENIEDLEAALSCEQEAVDIIPQHHPKRPHCLQNLGVSYSLRFGHFGDEEDLDTAIELLEAAVNLTPEGDADRAGRLNSLSNAYRKRYLGFGDLDSLKAAIEHQQLAVTLTSTTDPERAEQVHDLAAYYIDWHRERGDMEHLIKAIEYFQEAVDHTPLDHPEHSQYVHSLAVAYRERFQRLGEEEDMDMSLKLAKAAVDGLPEDHSQRGPWFQSLATAHGDAFQRTSDLDHLKKALEYSHRAVDSLADDHPERTFHLQNLAATYAERFNRLNDLSDLEEALRLQHEVIAQTPAGHPRLAERRRNIAVTYTHRYRKLGNLQDLETAIQEEETAVEMTPDSHPKKAGFLQNLAISYGMRYQRLNETADLERALEYGKRAVILTPYGHPDRASCLQSLAVSHTDRYRRLKEVRDIELALDYKITALELIPKTHHERPGYLQSLADCYGLAYQHDGNMAHLDLALQLGQEAVEATPEDDPAASYHFQNLATSYMSRYDARRLPEDLDAVNRNFELSLGRVTSLPETLWRNLLIWSEFSAEFAPAKCMAAFGAAFKLLPELLWIGSAIPVRQENIRGLGISQATSDATRKCAVIPGVDLKLLVELIEQGLATIFQQMLQLKSGTELLDLEGVSADEIEQFQRLSMKLYGIGSVEDLTGVAHERNLLLAKLRKHPGLEYFLLPRPYSVLCSAASGGPVVILNSHHDGCDAIVILNPRDEPIRVPLSDISLAELEIQRDSMRTVRGGRYREESSQMDRLGAGKERAQKGKVDFDQTLSWLWGKVLQPIYETLHQAGIDGGRLWWLPTGAFTGLPLHACAPMSAEKFVHSYTSTLGSLVEANQKSSANGLFKLTAVAVPQTNALGANFLPHVKAEVQAIRSVLPAENPGSFITEYSATVDAVSAELEKCSWLHLACHGKQNLTDPTKSHLKLFQGNLELETILRMPLPQAQVVFLGACQTAMGDRSLVNESFHLGGGLIAAGFRGAVGTMWSMDDEDGPLVAEQFYTNLFHLASKNAGYAGQPQAGDAAEALQMSVNEMRKRKIAPERWIPFIHFGI